ncbi:MAG: MBL fold metallo-hydrolase [Candidatus Actinomarina sp.]|nr:MBL fold metallo-hydrolase [Candidatus Actinomarina sp.]
MQPEITKFNDSVYQIDVLMEDKPGRMSCYYIDSSDPILIEVGPSNSFPYLVSALNSLGIENVNRSAITHLHLDHVGGIGHVVEKYKNHFVYIHELGIKHLPNPEKLWNAVAAIYTEDWLTENWGKIKPTPIENIKILNDGFNFDLGNNRKLSSIYSPGHAKHHFSFYDSLSKTIFMGDTLGLIYPHGDFVQPNLPPPDFNRDVLIKTLEDISKLELNYIGIAHFGIHEKPYKLIDDAINSIDKWVNFVKDIPELSNQEAAKKLQEWVTQNYKALKIDNQTISNYMQNSNFEMQIWGLRNSLI